MSKAAYERSKQLTGGKKLETEEVINVYKDWAATYDRDLEEIQYNPPKVGAGIINELLGNNATAKILDCAAGTGLVAQELVKLGYSDIDALDASQEMLEQAKRKGVYKKLICDYMGPNKLDIETDTYDALIAVGAFSRGHVKDDCLPELIRITKPGGYIVITLRERNLQLVEEYKDGKLERTFKSHEENKHWKHLEKRIVANYYDDYNGVAFIFQVS